MERKCQECGEPVAGRSDKKFCSDQCRTSYHNRVNSSANQLLRQINRILKRNRRILVALNDTGKTIVPVQRLLERGFDFRYFTNCSEPKTGRSEERRVGKEGGSKSKYR